MVSQAELILRLSFLGSWSYLSFFRDGMGPFNMPSAFHIDITTKVKTSSQGQTCRIQIQERKRLENYKLT